MLVELDACTPVPLRLTVCIVPAVPPLSSVKVSVPIDEPTEPGAKATSSEQFPPAAIGDALTQFVVVVKLADAETALTCKSAVPVLLSVTVCVALVVPTGWLPKVKLDVEREAVGAAADPVKT